MKYRNEITLWAPRILSILFILFMMYFSLNVFEGHSTFWQAVLGLVVINLPVLVLIGAVIIAWKRELVGTVVFGSYGAILLIFWLYRHLGWKQVLTGVGWILVPVLLISTLYFMAWHRKRSA